MIKLAPTLGRPIKRKRTNSTKNVFLKCQHCGTFYEVPHFMKNRRKYCSRTCGSRAFNKTRQIYTVKTDSCLLCGDEFTFKSYPRKKDQRFCSTDCCNIYHRRIKRNEDIIKKAEEDFNELVCNV